MAERWVIDSFVAVLSSPPWKCQIENFIDEHCLVFDGEDENQFAYTDVHKRYQKMVELQLEMLMAHMGISVEQFMAATAAATLPGSDHKELFEQVQAAEDFIVFKNMMTRRNMELNQQAMKMLARQQSPAHTAAVDADTASTSHSVKMEQAKEKEAEEEELQEVLRKSMEDYELGYSRGLSVEEREVEEEELQQALQQSMVEYEQSLKKNEQPVNVHTSVPAPTSSREQAPPIKHMSSPIAGISEAPITTKRTEDTTLKELGSTTATSTETSVITDSKKKTGADAAADWLASAREEAKGMSEREIMSRPAKQIDIKERQSYLRKKRDELVARNQQQRKKDLETFANTNNQSTTPPSATTPPSTIQLKTKQGTSSKPLADGAKPPTASAATNKPVLCSALASKLRDQ